jgi:hypothetical protein
LDQGCSFKASALPQITFKASKKPACLDRVQTALLAAAAKREAQPLLCTNPLHGLLGQFAVSDHEPVSVANLFAFMFSIDHR